MPLPICAVCPVCEMDKEQKEEKKMLTRCQWIYAFRGRERIEKNDECAISNSWIAKSHINKYYILYTTWSHRESLPALMYV